MKSNEIAHFYWLAEILKVVYVMSNYYKNLLVFFIFIINLKHCQENLKWKT